MRSVIQYFDLFDETKSVTRSRIIFKNTFDYPYIEILSEILIYVEKPMFDFKWQINIHLDSYLEVKDEFLKQSEH
jgi:hypothetical protein